MFKCKERESSKIYEAEYDDGFMLVFADDDDIWQYDPRVFWEMFERCEKEQPMKGSKL